MPLIYSNQINTATKIGVWHITEAENFFLQKVSLQRSITHPHKRLQHLAGRHLLLDLFPNFPLPLIQIADTRKPFLADEAFHFSISHCGDFAAAVVSTQNRVGVDIEIPHPKVERIQHKFITLKEKNILEKVKANDYHILTMAWSIKEAMFKWQGIGEVDFKKHIILKYSNNSLHEGVVLCEFLKEQKISLNIQYKFFNNICLAWVIQ